VFTGKELLEQFPDAEPIEANGKATNKEWYMGLCPTHTGVRRKNLERIRTLLDLDINGVWLDFIRYPTKWEESEPIIMDTCYCDRCMALFSEFVGEDIDKKPSDRAKHIRANFYNEWTRFKTEQISSFVQQVKNMLYKESPGMKLGLFAIPWDENEHNGAIKNILGQNHKQLSEYVDIFSPMLYHEMCGKDVGWIKEKVEYFDKFNVPLLPLIQTEEKYTGVNLEEFRTSLELASESPSSGVCVFFLDDLMKKPEKYEVVKGFFAGN
jgi:hypothetical protein